MSKNKLNGQVPRTIICKKCDKRKPASAYSKNSVGKHGLRSFCKPCWCDYIRQYRTSPKGRIATLKTNKKWIDKQLGDVK